MVQQRTSGAAILSPLVIDVLHACLTCFPVQHGHSHLLKNVTDMLQTSVDRHNIPGFEEVDNLARYLLSFTDEDRLAINSEQVAGVVELWRRLHEHDRGRTVPRPRFSSGEPRGRFRQTKTPTNPGIEAARRYNKEQGFRHARALRRDLQ